MPELSFGEWLKRRRKGMGLTQRQLAARINCSTIMLKKVEAEERHPSAQIVERLAEIFKIPPDEQTKFLSFARGDWKSTPGTVIEDAPWRISSSTSRSNLPASLTPLIGREHDISVIQEYLADVHTRLITLIGPPGIGKTRLSIEAAQTLLPYFPHGVYFIELAPLSDPALVPNTIASVLGVREEQGRPLMATLLDWLRNKQLLFILDNCEHLIEACAKFADAVLHASRETRILASSREALCIAGETAYRVPSLECPTPAQANQIRIEQLELYTAVRLFIERATQALTTFSVTNANAPVVAQICYQLDGIPLAIELAAARVKALSVEQIAARLDDRFHLLTGGSRTALPRHQTLRALIDWSYNLLAEEERLLFRRLAVFVGGWTLEAAEEVCAGVGQDTILSDDVLDLLTQLVNKSLVVVIEHPQSGETRYRMLETIRQYAREKLLEAGGSEVIRDRHLAYFVKVAEYAEPELQSHGQLIWLHRLGLEIDNIRAALESALSGDYAEMGLRLAGATVWFWWPRGYFAEAKRWLRQALEKSGAKVQTKVREKALNALGFALWMSGEFAEAHALLEDSVNIGRVIGEKLVLVESLIWLGFVTSSTGDYAASRVVLEEALALSRKLGHKRGMGLSLVGFGDTKLSEGNYNEAQASFEEGAALLRETGIKDFLAYPVRRLGQIALRQSDYNKASALCIESLTLNLEAGDERGVAACLAAIASIAAKQGRATRAAHLFGATATWLEGSFDRELFMMDQIENEPYMLAARAEIGEEEYSKAFSEGHAMTLEQAIALALEENS